MTEGTEECNPVSDFGLVAEAAADKLRQQMMWSEIIKAHTAGEDFLDLVGKGLRPPSNSIAWSHGNSGDPPSSLPIHVSGSSTGYTMVEFDMSVIRLNLMSDRQYHGERWLEGLA